MNTKKNNKLIAEFMGDADTTSQIDYDDRIGLTVTEIPRTKWYYHEKWDWLMLVVEKIQDIHDLVYCVTIDQNNCKIWHETDSYFGIECTGYTTIEATYKAVIEFIKWNNEKI